MAEQAWSLCASVPDCMLQLYHICISCLHTSHIVIKFGLLQLTLLKCYKSCIYSRVAKDACYVSVSSLGLRFYRNGNCVGLILHKMKWLLDFGQWGGVGTGRDSMCFYVRKNYLMLTKRMCSTSSRRVGSAFGLSRKYLWSKESIRC